MRPEAWSKALYKGRRQAPHNLGRFISCGDCLIHTILQDHLLMLRYHTLQGMLMVNQLLEGNHSQHVAWTA